MKKVNFVFLLIFSLLIINGVEYKCEVIDDSFNIIEDYVLEQCDFSGNGIKMEYTTKTSEEDEFNRIKAIFDKNKNFNVICEKNNISAEGENINYSVKMFKFNDVLKVEVIILNYDKNLQQKKLKVLAEEVRNNNFIDERFFSFVKGKLKTDDKEIIKEIENKININSIETMEINNGYITKLITKRNEKINISKVNYDTGSYLIIGTPIIFITY